MRKKQIGGPVQENGRILEIKGQWLEQKEGSENFYRYWYDPGLRRTRRASLGTSDVEEAKDLLIAIVYGEPDNEPLSPESVLMAQVLKFYMDSHGNGVRASNSARRACTLVNDYLRKTVSPAPKVADFTLSRQRAFMKWCCDEHGFKAKTIYTYLSTIKAAMARAIDPYLIYDSKGEEREVVVLNRPYAIHCKIDLICKVTGQPRPGRREWIPNDSQLVEFINAIEHEHIFRFVIQALNTWARPEANIELSINNQVDFERGIIDLNPPGRAQTKKIRPKIRLTDNLRGWYLDWDIDRPIVYGRRAVRTINNSTFKKITAKVGMPELVPYTLRHYMATRTRSLQGMPVSREERATWMGHTDPDHRTTEEWYESFSPNHLVNARDATDLIMKTLNKKSEKNLYAPNMRPSDSLQLIESAEEFGT